MYFTDIMALILTYLHVISATVYAILGAVVLRLDARSWQNRILFLLLSLFSIWSVGYGVVSNPHVSRETAILFDNIAAIGWIGFPGLFFTFALFFTGRKRAVIASLAGIFIVQLLLLLSQWRGSLITGDALYMTFCSPMVVEVPIPVASVKVWVPAVALKPSVLVPTRYE